jgi:hypothetical protein
MFKISLNNCNFLDLPKQSMEDMNTKVGSFAGLSASTSLSEASEGDHTDHCCNSELD